MDKLYVIGNPIKHSKSPIIHNYWIKKYCINAEYEKLKVNEIELKNIIKNLKNGTIKGLNVTIPFKQKIVTYLDEIDESAKSSLAVNTVFVKKKKIIGANTDGKGFFNSLYKDINYRIQPSSSVLLVGAGGAAYGIFSELLKKKISSIEITNRTASRARDLVSHFHKLEARGKIRIGNTEVSLRPWGFNPSSKIDLIINASSLGMKKDDKCDIHFQNLTKKAFIYDIIYNPRETIIMKEAIRHGISCSNGIYMLVRQAAESFQKWYDIKVNNDDINEVVKLLGY